MANNSINRPPWNASTRVLSYRAWYSPPLSSIPSLPGKPKDFSHVIPKVNYNNRQIPKRPHMEKGGPLIPASSTLPDIDASASNYESEFITLAPAVPLIHPINQCTADSENISEPEIATESVNLASAVPLITVDQCTADSETVSEPVIATESITLSPAVPLIMTNQCTADSETKTEPQMMESNSVPLLSHIGAHPLPSPTGRRGGVMAPTIASSAKQRAKFQAVENSRRIGKERWHTNAKPHHGVSNNDLPGNFKNMYSHIGPRVSTTWDHTDGPEDDDNTSDNEVKNKVDDLASSNEMEPDDYEEYSKTKEFEQLPFEERLKLFKKHQRFLRSVKKPDLETELHEERKAYMELFKRSCQDRQLICDQEEQIRLLKEQLNEAYSELFDYKRNEEKRRKKATHMVTLLNGAVVSLPPEYSVSSSIRLECTNITFIDTVKPDENSAAMPVSLVHNEAGTINQIRKPIVYRTMELKDLGGDR